MSTLYTTKATSVAGRGGHVETDDKSLSLNLSKPGNGKGNNPEQLFASGYSACFGSAVEAVAKDQKIDVKEIKISATVNLNKDDAGGYFLSAQLDGNLSGIDDETAAELMRKAHQVCPYSKATRNNIKVQLKINGKEVD